MSLCYDFQKWIILSLAGIAISLTIGPVLMQYGQGQGQNMTQQEQTQRDIIIQEQIRLDNLKPLVNYCFQHADRPNPLQDLIDKGFLPESFKETCKSIIQTYDKVQLDLKLQEQKLQDIEVKQQQKQRDIEEKQQQKQRDIEVKQRLQYQAKLIEQAMNNTNFNNCLSQNMSVELCYDTYIGNRPTQEQLEH